MIEFFLFSSGNATENTQVKFFDETINNPNVNASGNQGSVGGGWDDDDAVVVDLRKDASGNEIIETKEQMVF